MNEEKLINLICEIGRLLLKYNAEIYRVEESLIRMCHSYGYSNVEVFAIPTYFTLTIENNDEHTYTITKRTKTNRTNLDKVYELNNLVRSVCENKPNYDELKQEIKKLRSYEDNMKLVFIGYIIGAGFFTVFFGGDVKELICGCFIGAALYAFIDVLERLGVNNLVNTLLCSMLIAIIAILSYSFKLIDNLDATIIGSLMILTPGVAITNSLRDIMGGDYVSGMSRMIEALLVACFIALGVGSILVLGGY